MSLRPSNRLAMACVALLALLASLAPAQAQVRVDITEGEVRPLPIAVSNLFAEGADSQVGQDIAGVIINDLRNSGLFETINQAAYLQTPQQLQSRPRFEDWRLIDAEALVSGAVTRQPDGRLRVEYRLWDVLAENQMDGLAFFTEPENWRRVSHIIADAVYERITGEPGYFDTRIVYISESGPANARVKRLAIMDQDGANHSYLTDGSHLVLTPRFSPSAQEITYLSYFNDRPRVYLYNIDAGTQELLGDFPGMTFAPRFSPDGNAVVLSQAQSGNTDIYRMDLRTRQVSRLTSDQAIDTSPSFSPDGSRIAFESDRGGSQQIYVMGADGSGVQRVSHGDGRFGSPVWSPRGDLIAFTRLYQGQFSIGVMRPDGTGMRILAEAYHAEGPTWAPNGRVLAYFSETPSAQGAVARLMMVDLTGRVARQIPTPQNGSDPAWSPLIP